MHKAFGFVIVLQFMSLLPFSQMCSVAVALNEFFLMYQTCLHLTRFQVLFTKLRNSSESNLAE